MVSPPARKEKRMLKPLVSIAALLLLTVSANAQTYREAVSRFANAAPDLTFPSEVGELGTFSPLQMAIYKPSGDGPFPAVVILPSCGGLRPEILDWAKRTVARGYVAFVVDPVTQRGQPVCVPNSPSNHYRGTKDAFQALAHLVVPHEQALSSAALERTVANAPTFDLAAAHKYFAADCFNKAWDLMERRERTPEDDRLMVVLNQASIFHWLKKPDCTSENLSVGHWQASRIQALLGNATAARRHAEACLSYSAALEPFYVGYAFEAFARAAVFAGETAVAAEHLSQARRHAASVAHRDHQAMLLKDLDSLGR
jgi:hypothetical protein